ncbi:MAG: hypothetical protein GX075_03675 [Firmicutes bacterium]|nr:hypothetical protein [Bacillota bacterium]
METVVNQGLSVRKRNELRRFGFSFGAGMAILVVVGLWKEFGSWVIIPAGLLSLFHFGCALFRIELLRPTHSAVSFVGAVLGRAVTALVFTLVFYLLFTPIAVILRLCKKDVIANNSRSPAWIPIPERQNDPERVRRLF